MQAAIDVNEIGVHLNIKPSTLQVALTNNDLSFMCMESCDALTVFEQESNEKITTIQTLKKKLDVIFNEKNFDIVHKKLLNLLERTDLNSYEIEKYTFWDFEKQYTRNLITTDNKHYTLLLLCWSPGKESRIHNHPCDGCYVKTIRGCIRECFYAINNKDISDFKLSKTRFYREGQVSYLNDHLGLHKIGNPNRDTGSVSLHLYTPPFASCKVWVDDSQRDLSHWEDTKLGFFSVYGHRSPQLEGRQGTHSKLMTEVRSYQRHLVDEDDTVYSSESDSGSERCSEEDVRV